MTPLHIGHITLVMSTPLRISAKHLGALALPDCCHRCFWMQFRLGWKTPYAVFPGIFSSLDSAQKKVVNAFHARHGRNPSWLSSFEPLGTPIAVPHHSKFRWTDPETGALLTGVPDELFRQEDRALFIADYKTAKFTANQDSLLPVYTVQLNGYAVIAEALGMGTVTGLGLIYFEPRTDIGEADVDALTTEEGFLMRFEAKLLNVDLNRAMIRPLLRRARELFTMPSPPAGRDGCKDCGKLDALFALPR